MGDEPTTGELRVEQLRRAERERERERESEAGSDDERRAHERRADKADYLEHKLREREQAESERSED
jgi:hypothetical protein